MGVRVYLCIYFCVLGHVCAVKHGHVELETLAYVCRPNTAGQPSELADGTCQSRVGPDDDFAGHPPLCASAGSVWHYFFSLSLVSGFDSQAPSSALLSGMAVVVRLYTIAVVGLPFMPEHNQPDTAVQLSHLPRTQSAVVIHWLSCWLVLRSAE